MSDKLRSWLISTMAACLVTARPLGQENEEGLGDLRGIPAVLHSHWRMLDVYVSRIARLAMPGGVRVLSSEEQESDRHAQET